MDLRLGLYQLAARYQLDAGATGQLAELAGLNREPAALTELLGRGVAVLGAALGGLGVLLWIAANWSVLGRFGRFGLLEGFFLLLCVGAMLRPSARPALSLLALLSIGGLFAYFGQTYQTGADPWQLFAVWSALALPLCLGLRSDILWTPWMLVTMTGVSLWVQAHAGHQWSVDAAYIHTHATGWVAVLTLTLLSSPLLQRFTGAGVWTFRLAVTLATLTITASALGSLFDRDSNILYWTGLLLLFVAGGALGSKQLFEMSGLSAIALALNVLLVFGLARLLLQHFEVMQILLVGLFAAGLMAATVKLLMFLSQQHRISGAKA